MLAIRNEPVRFNQLKRQLDGISQKVLGRTLKTLERNGLVQRQVITVKPIAVAYGITDHGSRLTDIIELLRVWTIETQSITYRSQVEYDARLAVAEAAKKRTHRA